MKLTITKMAIILSFLSGFLSLALEVIWIRLFGFFSGGLPQAFSFTLAVFLLGIAIGALVGKDICKNNQDGQFLLDKIGHYLLMATAMDLFVVAILMFFPQMTIFAFLVGLLFCAIFRGVVFPIVHHLGTEQVKTGAAISNVYFANVLGSTIAPILVGFVFLEFMTTQQVYSLIMAITLVVALCCVRKKPIKMTIGGGLALVLAISMLPEKIIYNLSTQTLDDKLVRVIENKYGVVQEYVRSDGHHIVYGGNMYDGHMNTSLLTNINKVERAYFPVLTHTDAKNVLVIGLASGSWAKILTLLPNLEQMTIVELNPGYVELASFSPDMRDLLNHPKVKIVTDDGRRYISRHPNERYDLIVMNTTHYYRNQATSILSQQFLRLLENQVKPTGMLIYNPTGFLHSYATAKSVFPYVYGYSGMVVAAHQPIIQPSNKEMVSKLKTLRWQDGTPLVSNDAHLPIMMQELGGQLTPYEKIDFSLIKNNPQVITDENMINEYKYGYLYLLSNL